MVHCKAGKQKMAKLGLASGHVQTDDKMQCPSLDGRSFPRNFFVPFNGPLLSFHHVLGGCFTLVRLVRLPWQFICFICHMN